MTEVFFSPGMDSLNAIINRLENARRRVDICVFTISDDRIKVKIKELFDKGIDVRIITDNDKCFDKGSDITELAKYGVKIKVDKTRAHMHHKFAVIDKKISITGSYNWTRSAEKYNFENILVTNSRSIARAFRKEFERLWNEMKEYNPK